MANGAKDRLRDEMGPDFDDVDWKRLDPRQYDPRRIIREALLDDEEPAVVKPVVTTQAVARRRATRQGIPTPYDTEST
jgi:sec-independent protein translocase protein TatB